MILAGTGVRLANALEVFERVIRKLGIPVATAWTHDLIASDDPALLRPAGQHRRPGGQLHRPERRLSLLVLGSRLNVRQVSYNWGNFARHAVQNPGRCRCGRAGQADRHAPIRPSTATPSSSWKRWNVRSKPDKRPAVDHGQWLAWCRERVVKISRWCCPSIVSEPGRINPYQFVNTLYSQLADDDVVVCGDATACIVTFQTARLKKGQRLFSNSGCASMGYDLPAAVGAAVARDGKRVDLPGRRRQHPDEHPGAADRRPSPAGRSRSSS